MQRDGPPRAPAPAPRLPAPPIGAAASSGGGGGGGSGGGGGASAAPAPPGLSGTTSPRGPGGGRRAEEVGSAPRGRKWTWRRKWRGRGGAWSTAAGPGAGAATAAAAGGGGGALEAAMAKQYDSVECPFCDEVSKYEKLAKIGQGTFGEVFKAKHRKTGQKVALKKVLMENEKEGFPITALREIKILQLLKHENVVNLIEICRTKASPYNRCKGSIYLVFDFCEHDLAGLLSNVLVKFTLSEIKRVMQMLLNGLYYIHRNKILHRDMKAANVLITRDGVLKLADFGLARAFSLAKNSQPNRYTNRVVTLWYRPPELLLGERDYGPPIDLWGAGCIMAEMWTRSPIMQGNTEQHQLALISQLCGSITPEVWPNVDKYELFEKLDLVKGQKRKVKDRLKAYVRDPYALDLIDKLLVLDPAQRIDSDDALNHDFFWSDPMPSDLKGMLSTHLTSMFEYLAPPRRKGSQITQQSTNQSRNPAATNQTEFERVF
ncbi:cyclin-dependent kinase 9 [Orcinus orca]|uniref:cyclin-dependent kinase 9 n=1 Tax=Orcinus orca TaxID=9733 RepID=UPI00122F4F37|nr:cyclin-dependent kinase 9 [Orcinus orca]XP_030714452.1 cyclin-dependent kinase 9 [Globicephala melas]XP_060010267.1 cyclin-dependent kinase 9 isoform X2 [Lagenorhynchus albirostris]